ncbi:hypothetical protein [Pseudothioclava nitratireducens]|uniref:hypothetical protein n=1 Tax=Pseudothioclava nitratireducens TaxID=1928646 RepID=UPI0023DB670F|nr:hypothetical protein [Defluviimonas nitratireducens]MDF1620898.1 hypothetical protein [Defluviimonas nitratireducens]
MKLKDTRIRISVRSLVYLLRSSVLIATAAASFPALAQAQWFNQSWGGAFDGKPNQVAGVESGDYGFALRCTGPVDLVALYITAQSTEDFDFDALNDLGPQVLVRVDEDAPLSLSAVLQDINGYVRAEASAPPELLTQVISAKSRIALALQLDGQLYHEKHFNVVRSTVVGNKLAASCGLKLADQ